MAEKISRTLMENIITLLCHNDEFGKIIVNQLTPDLFEGDYRVIAERAVDYWNQYQRAPKDHTPDLVADILEDKENRRAPTYRRILVSMLELAEGINGPYVVNELSKFARLQKFKDAVIKSAEKLQALQEASLDEVTEIWDSLLRTRENNFEPGMRMSDLDRLLDYLESQPKEFLTGIPDLDKRQIVPIRKKLMVFIAPPNRGKTFFLVQVSKRALMLRKKVVFISLEMDEEEIIQRHYQSFLGVSKHDEITNVTKFDFNEDGKLVGFEEDPVEPDFNFDSEYLREELKTRMIQHESRLCNLWVKRFSPRSISVRGIASYLDNLEVVRGFIPDMIILDYIGRIKTNLDRHRLDLGAEVEAFRGLAIERNAACVTAHQAGREGAKSSNVREQHISEDFSLMNTADNLLLQSATPAERKLGLARILVGKARSEAGQFEVLINQAYNLGQYCLSSTIMTPKYFGLLKEKTGEDAEYDESEKEEDE